ncbi:hypothetical protein B484DRAFT_400504 [Ochromonadaceae sp. CCMP2298]|nr:hypothetical protein B484DRAFT_400504 [Ochromonadaceae sp. CCMP2298]
MSDISYDDWKTAGGKPKTPSTPSKAQPSSDIIRSVYTIVYAKRTKGGHHFLIFRKNSKGYFIHATDPASRTARKFSEDYYTDKQQLHPQRPHSAQRLQPLPQLHPLPYSGQQLYGGGKLTLPGGRFERGNWDSDADVKAEAVRGLRQGCGGRCGDALQMWTIDGLSVVTGEAIVRTGEDVVRTAEYTAEGTEYAGYYICVSAATLKRLYQLVKPVLWAGESARREIIVPYH